MKWCCSTGANGPASRSEVVDFQPAVHLFRPRLTAAATLRAARVPVRVEPHGDRLPEVNRSEMPWAEVDVWLKERHRDVEGVLAETTLPKRLDYEAANRLLVKARRVSASPLPDRICQIAHHQNTV